MTFRERLADWISGGALSRARRLRDEYLLAYGEADSDLYDLKKAMVQILSATSNGKSGTAQKIHRMAKEALGE